MEKSIQGSLGNQWNLLGRTTLLIFRQTNSLLRAHLVEVVVSWLCRCVSHSRERRSFYPVKPARFACKYWPPPPKKKAAAETFQRCPQHHVRHECRCHPRCCATGWVRSDVGIHTGSTLSPQLLPSWHARTAVASGENSQDFHIREFPLAQRPGGSCPPPARWPWRHLLRELPPHATHQRSSCPGSASRHYWATLWEACSLCSAACAWWYLKERKTCIKLIGESGTRRYSLSPYSFSVGWRQDWCRWCPIQTEKSPLLPPLFVQNHALEEISFMHLGPEQVGRYRFPIGHEAALIRDPHVHECCLYVYLLGGPANHSQTSLVLLQNRSMWKGLGEPISDSRKDWLTLTGSTSVQPLADRDRQGNPGAHPCFARLVERFQSLAEAVDAVQESWRDSCARGSDMESFSSKKKGWIVIHPRLKRPPISWPFLKAWGSQGVKVRLGQGNPVKQTRHVATLKWLEGGWLYRVRQK